MLNTIQKADINKLMIFPVMNEKYLYKYHILVEWSRLPVETFNSKQDAEDFISGFKLLNTDRTKAYIQGTILRHCVETDIQEGIVYEKVLDLNNFSMEV